MTDYTISHLDTN